MKISTLLIIFCSLVTSCSIVNSQAADVVTPGTPTTEPTMATLPNPASVYCEQQGYTLEIRTSDDGSQSGVCIFYDGNECDEWAYYRGECAPASQQNALSNPASAYCKQHGYTLEIRAATDGNQSGVCVFPDGSECDEWAYYRGECKPTGVQEPTGTPESPMSTPVYDSQGWKIYHNDELGYSFHYPAEAELITNDDPLKDLFIYGSGMSGETWSIAHPGDRGDYRPPKDVDLLQWLTDHYLLGENRAPDVQIAETTAIHFRHEQQPAILLPTTVITLRMMVNCI